MARFAVKFVTEKGKPVAYGPEAMPMWVAVGVRRKNYGSYSGVQWQVTPMPSQAATFAKRETAERWAYEMSSETYGFEAVEAPEGSA